MIDPRFFEALGPATARALAPSADIGGDSERAVSGVAPAERAGPNDLCYYEPKKGGAPLETAPAACIVAPALAHLAPKAGALIFSDKRATFARLALAPFRCAFSTSRGDQRIELMSASGGRCHRRGRRDAGAEIGPNAVIGPASRSGGAA